MKTIIRTVVLAEIEHDKPFNDTYHALHDIILQSDLLDYRTVLGSSTEDQSMRVVSIMISEDTVAHLNSDHEYED